MTALEVQGGLGGCGKDSTPHPHPGVLWPGTLLKISLLSSLPLLFLLLLLLFIHKTRQIDTMVIQLSSSKTGILIQGSQC